MINPFTRTALIIVIFFDINSKEVEVDVHDIELRDGGTTSQKGSNVRLRPTEVPVNELFDVGARRGLLRQPRSRQRCSHQTSKVPGDAKGAVVGVAGAIVSRDVVVATATAMNIYGSLRCY